MSSFWIIKDPLFPFFKLSECLSLYLPEDISSMIDRWTRDIFQKCFPRNLHISLKDTKMVPPFQVWLGINSSIFSVNITATQNQKFYIEPLFLIFISNKICPALEWWKQAGRAQPSNYIFTTTLFLDVIRIMPTSLLATIDRRICFISFVIGGQWSRWPAKSTRIYLFSCSPTKLSSRGGDAIACLLKVVLSIDHPYA